MSLDMYENINIELLKLMWPRCKARAFFQFHENNDEDLKVIDVSPIRRRPKNSESLDLDAKFGKSGIGEVTTLNSNHQDHGSLEYHIKFLELWKHQHPNHTKQNTQNL